MKQAVTYCVKTYGTDFCYAGIHALVQRWDKWLNISGDYVEVWCVPSAIHASKSVQSPQHQGTSTLYSLLKLLCTWRMGRRIVVMKLPVTTCPQLRPFSSYCIPQPAKDFDTVLRCAVRSPLIGCQVTSWPRDRFSRYSKWLDTFLTDLVHAAFWQENLNRPSGSGMAHAHKPDFVSRRNGLIHLNRRWRRLLAAEVCASAVVMLDTPDSEVVWRVLATHSIRQFPHHFPSRASQCAITFQLDSILNFRHRASSI